MAAPIPATITVDQGRDWYLTVTYEDSTGTPINLTGYTASFALASFNNTLALTLTSPTSITLGGSAGMVTIHATAAQTSLDAGQYNAELVITSSTGIKTSLLKGRLVVSPKVG
jgi:predicted ATP-dependent Lon-type protease